MHNTVEKTYENMNHVMLDLETMGYRGKSAIISIGAVAFNPDNNTLGETFYVTVDLSSCLHNGLEVDGETVMWWIKQSAEAKKTFGENPLSLLDALTEFTNYIDKFKQVKVWGNGLGFDNVIIKNAYSAVGLERPWNDFKDRDMRTVVEIVESIYGRQKKENYGVAHNALDDAINQAKTICKYWNMLKVNN